MRVEKVEIESIGKHARLAAHLLRLSLLPRAVFKEGDEGRSLSVLLNGSAAVFVKKPVDRQHSFVRQLLLCSGDVCNIA